LNEPTSSQRIARLLLFGYLGFLVYGSLYPISSFRPPEESPLALLFGRSRLSRTDILANLLVYLPFGWLLGARGLSWTRAGLLGGLLSFAVEWLQTYLPGRVPSLVDFGLNTAGTVLGAALAKQFGRARWLELPWLRGVPPRAALGLAAAATWMASQLFPFVPSIDVGALRAGLRPIGHVLTGRTPFSFGETAVYALTAIALSRILLEVLPPSFRYRAYVPSVFLAVLAAKVPIVSRQLSLEALLGVAAGLALSRVVAGGKSHGWIPFLAAAGAFVLDELQSGSGSSALRPFNWIPLRNSLENELVGAADMLATAWPFLAMAYVASGESAGSSRRRAFGGGRRDLRRGNGARVDAVLPARSLSRRHRRARGDGRLAPRMAPPQWQWL
jgi:VanZ family protein